jgi:hypothetical protein
VVPPTLSEPFQRIKAAARPRRGQMMRFVLFALPLSLPAPAVEGQRLAGTLYKVDSQRQVRLYTWEMVLCPEVWKTRYFNLDGELVVDDRTEYKAGKFAAYSYVRHAIGERSSVKLDGQSVHFSYNVRGRERTKTLRNKGIVLTGPAVFSFVQTHLSELKKGQQFEFQFAVVDQLDTFTFKLSGESEPGSELFRVAIKPTSFFVGLALSPVSVTLSNSGKFLAVNGRSIVMETDGRRLLTLDADMVVESESTVSCPNG